jgi:hypothetical protein
MRWRHCPPQGRGDREEGPANPNAPQPGEPARELRTVGAAPQGLPTFCEVHKPPLYPKAEERRNHTPYLRRPGRPRLPLFVEVGLSALHEAGCGDLELALSACSFLPQTGVHSFPTISSTATSRTWQVGSRPMVAGR